VVFELWHHNAQKLGQKAKLKGQKAGYWNKRKGSPVAWSLSKPLMPAKGIKDIFEASMCDYESGDTG